MKSTTTTTAATTAASAADAAATTNIVFVFDFDDTLWTCHSNYMRSMNEFGSLMQEKVGGNAEDNIALFEKVDGAWAKERGLAGSRWLESMFATMGIICGRERKIPNEELMSNIEKIADIPWECPELYEGTEQVLKDLRHHCIPVFGFSAGDERQNEKIRKLKVKKGFNLGKYMDDYRLVMIKDVKTHSTFLEDLKKPRGWYPGGGFKYVFIGDSVINDIIPSIKAGYDLSIRITRDFHWPRVDGSIKAEWPEADSLQEAVDYAFHYFTNNSQTKKGNQ